MDKHKVTLGYDDWFFIMSALRVAIRDEKRKERRRVNKGDWRSVQYVRILEAIAEQV